jgi:hypothetical protein
MRLEQPVPSTKPGGYVKFGPSNGGTLGTSQATALETVNGPALDIAPLAGIRKNPGTRPGAGCPAR